MKRIRDTLERMASAVAFAEEGLHDEALRLTDGLGPLLASSNGKVVLAALGEPFRPAVVDYMAGLVERMRCDVLALTVCPDRRALKRLSADNGAGDALKPLAERTRAANTLLRPLAVTGDLCAQADAICHRLKGMQFAVIQSPGQRFTGCELSVPVFVIRP